MLSHSRRHNAAQQCNRIERKWLTSLSLSEIQSRGLVNDGRVWQIAAQPTYHLHFWPASALARWCKRGGLMRYRLFVLYRLYFRISGGGLRGLPHTVFRPIISAAVNGYSLSTGQALSLDPGLHVSCPFNFIFVGRGCIGGRSPLRAEGHCAIL